MKMVNFNGEVVADDEIDDGETIVTSSLGFNIKNRKQLSKEQQIKTLGILRSLFESDDNSDD